MFKSSLLGFLLKKTTRVLINVYILQLPLRKMFSIMVKEHAGQGLHLLDFVTKQRQIVKERRSRVCRLSRGIRFEI